MFWQGDGTQIGSCWRIIRNNWLLKSNGDLDLFVSDISKFPDLGLIKVDNFVDKLSIVLLQKLLERLMFVLWAESDLYLRQSPHYRLILGLVNAFEWSEHL